MQRRLVALSIILIFNIGVILWRIPEKSPQPLNSEFELESNLKNRSSSLPSLVKAIGENFERNEKQIYAGKYLLFKGEYSNDNDNDDDNDDDDNNDEIDEDKNRLIDLKNFQYLLQQNPCSKEIQALIIVHSAPGNLEKRQFIRETWANRELLDGTPLRVLFFLGAVDDDEQQQEFTMESNRYGDIVQGSFLDAYHNLSYKHVMALKWTTHYCSRAHLLMKIDDDIFVNTLALLGSSSSLSLAKKKFNFNINRKIISPKDESDDDENAIAPAFRNRPHDLLLCQRTEDARVKRTYRSKWRVSWREYERRYYPPFCPGFAIVYSMDVVKRLYRRAQEHKFFWIDDVFITGIVAQSCNITITPIADYILTLQKYESLLQNRSQEPRDRNGSGNGNGNGNGNDNDTNDHANEFLFSSHNFSARQLRSLWNYFLKVKESWSDTAAPVMIGAVAAVNKTTTPSPTPTPPPPPTPAAAAATITTATTKATATKITRKRRNIKRIFPKAITAKFLQTINFTFHIS